MNGKQRVIIENIKPSVDNGKHQVKRVINEILNVSADIFCDSHDFVAASVMFKQNSENKWNAAPMQHIVNDRWQGVFPLEKQGVYVYRVKAWADPFQSWHRDILKKINAHTDYEVDLLVGADIIAKTIKSYTGITPNEKSFLEDTIFLFNEKNKALEDKIQPVTSNQLLKILNKYPLHQNASVSEKEFEVLVERERSNFSAWYEVFPRSLSKNGFEHGTFKDCEAFLPYVSEMGFDVLYLPPVHPIGETNRKGKNNSVAAKPGEPGSPWAIGGKGGGHKSIHPELGDIEDFERFIQKAGEYGMEIAMDIAFQCSPDHPYVKENPQWFKKRPDGSLQYAENPPKKYQDIYPIYFETDDWEALWKELKSVFLYWIDKGVKIFRVDNPHTKSLNFWGWVINEIKQIHHDVIFLAEAFTRPKVMYNLAKQGFTQSYTYFTWRNTKFEITSYCEALVNSESREFFRPNFWPNTPDILPEFLQVTNQAGYIQRVLLAATLSSNYGIYGPAYELMENKPIAPGKEEYLDSEKFEIKNWDVANSRGIQKVIKRINKIRKENKALQNTHSLRFHPIDNEALICYSKKSDDLENIIVVVVNLDPYHTHSGWLKLPLDEFEIENNSSFQVHDLLGGSYYLWNGEHNYVEINPEMSPGHIFRLRRKVRTEQDFDYFM